MPFTRTIPILRILDQARHGEVYVDCLGFKIDWGNRASGALFMQISLDECGNSKGTELVFGAVTRGRSDGHRTGSAARLAPPVRPAADGLLQRLAVCGRRRA